MALQENLERILADKNQRLEDIPNDFTDRVKRFQPNILDQLLALVSNLETDGPNLAPTESNLLAIEAILIQLKQFVSTSEYIESVRAFASEFDGQTLINNTFFREAFEDFTVNTTSLNTVLNNKRNTVRKLIEESLDTPFYNPIRDTLIDAVSTGSSLTETIASLRLDVVGGESKGGIVLGKLERYTKQISVDAFADSDRAYTNQVSIDLEAEFFLYSGGLIQDSRVFCVNRNGKFWHRNQIIQWGEGKLVDSGRAKGGAVAGGDWQGKRTNTNASTIFVFLGGFNCLHSIMPVSTFVVSKTALQENLQNGNWSPTALERERLL